MSTRAPGVRGGRVAAVSPVRHHVVSASAMLACALAGHRPDLSALVVAVLVAVTIVSARRARRDPAARELVLDLGVMAIVMLAMVPWAAAATSVGSALTMSQMVMTADGTGGALSRSVCLLAAALWAVARARLLIRAERPGGASIAGAVTCSACLVWMLA